MSKKYEIKYLSKYFHLRYPNDRYPEFENKDNRPYVVFLLKIEEHIFVIPFRTNMNHKYGYKFKNTGKDSENGTGLDFTKAVIVDKKEFLELSEKYSFIRSKFIKYLEGYYKFINANLTNIKKKHINIQL